MKLTLMIEGSAAAIAQILARLPDDVSVTKSAPEQMDDVARFGVVQGNETHSTSTGTGTPVAPASPPSVPNMAAPNPAAPNLPTMPMPTIGAGDSAPTTSPAADEDEDESGGVSDGSGVDAEGLPWDERIHSSTKTKTAKGTWTKRRGGPKGEELAAIEAELRGGSPQPTAAPTMPVPAPVAQPAPAPMPQMAPPPAVAPAMPTPAPVAAAPAMPPAQPDPAPAPAAAGPLDFSGFMAKLTPLFQMRDEAGAPLVHADYLATITAEISNAFQQAGHIQQPLTALTDIQNNQQMVDYAVALLKRDGKWVD